MTPAELANEMAQSLEAFKAKPQEEQKKIANAELIAMNIIDESGEFTDHYAYSRDYYRKKINERN